MSALNVWATLAQDFRCKPLHRATLNPCGSRVGWARPASLLPNEERYQDAGCCCHTDMEQALILWRREIVGIRLAAQIRREENTLGQKSNEHRRRRRRFDQEIYCSVFKLLRLRMSILRAQENLEGRFSQDELERRANQPDKPVALAGPVTWTDKVYNPR